LVQGDKRRHIVSVFHQDFKPKGVIWVVIVKIRIYRIDPFHFNLKILDLFHHLRGIVEPNDRDLVSNRVSQLPIDPLLLGIIIFQDHIDTEDTDKVI
jgi:hypothetical protein